MAAGKRYHEVVEHDGRGHSHGNSHVHVFICILKHFVKEDNSDFADARSLNDVFDHFAAKDMFPGIKQYISVCKVKQRRGMVGEPSRHSLFLACHQCCKAAMDAFLGVAQHKGFEMLWNQAAANDMERRAHTAIKKKRIELFPANIEIGAPIGAGVGIVLHSHASVLGRSWGGCLSFFESMLEDAPAGQHAIF